MQPKFQHDCNTCRFIGHYFNHDVYICSSCPIIARYSNGESIIARYGNGESDFASSDLSYFLKLIIKNNSIQQIGEVIVPFQDYLFSEYVSQYHKAWAVAIIVEFANDRLPHIQSNDGCL